MVYALEALLVLLWAHTWAQRRRHKREMDDCRIERDLLIQEREVKAVMLELALMRRRKHALEDEPPQEVDRAG